jgi:flagellar hook-associated protein 2
LDEGSESKGWHLLDGVSQEQVEAMSSVSSVNSLLSSSASTTSSTSAAVSLSNMLAAETGATTAGIDVTSAVAAAIYADRAPERIWQSDQTTLTSQTTALTAIQTATQAIATDMQSMNTLTGPLATRTVSSSNSNYVTATAATGTVTGSHTVVVNNLASTATWYSDLATSATATLPTASFTLTTKAGASATFATGSGKAGDTLNDLATAINGSSLGVTATVVTDSTGSRLAIVSNSVGAANDFSVSEPYTSWTAPQMSSGETLAANSFTLTSATTPATTATVNTTSGESYALLADAINAITPSLGVNAVATTDSSGNTNLTITSNDGATPFTINEPSAATGGFGFTQAVAGADASLTVDGVPIDSASNTVTGAINGVTLNLLGATSGNTINLTVASDTSSVSTAINQFVTDYNTAIGLLNTQFSMTSSTDSSGNTTSAQGVLASDPTVVSLQNALEQAAGYVNTPTTGTTTVSTLNDLGITVGNDGTLSVDSTTLSNALSNNASDVQNFFEGASLNGFANSLNNTLDSFTNAADGAFKVDLSSIATENSDLTTQINNFETSYISVQQTLLTADFSKAEIALQELPEEMQQLNSELGFNSNGSSS